MRMRLARLLLHLADKVAPWLYVWGRFNNVVHICGVAVEHTEDGPQLAVMPPANMSEQKFLALLIKQRSGILEQLSKEGFDVEQSESIPVNPSQN